MTHLGERITDFVFGELSAAEMKEAQQHLSLCPECRDAVGQFERTRSLLRMSPDVEPPRRIVFEIERRRPAGLWRWLAPVAVAAAILIGVLTAQPHVQWSNSQLTIAFGTVPPPAVVAQPPAAQAAAIEPVDYEKFLKQMLDKELDKRDAAQLKKIQNLQDQLAFVEAYKREFERSTLQLMADSGVQ